MPISNSLKVPKIHQTTTDIYVNNIPAKGPLGTNTVF